MRQCTQMSERDSDRALSFDEIFAQELEDIRASREGRKQTDRRIPPAPTPRQAEILENTRTLIEDSEGRTIDQDRTVIEDSAGEILTDERMHVKDASGEVFSEKVQLSRNPRRGRGRSEEDSSSAGDSISRGAQSQLFGVAFSGGGIRSATFNLGVLQALAELKLLARVDYLSTVSGGGFIGSWLAAWIYRCKDRPDESTRPGPVATLDEESEIEKVSRMLQPEWADQNENDGVREPLSGKRPQSPPQVEFLREYSNYLTPRVGLFGADTWAAVATVVRNLLLNLTILILALSGVLLLPRTITRLSRAAMTLPNLCFWSALALVAIGVIDIGANLRSFSPGPEKHYSFYDKPGWVTALIFLIFSGAWFSNNWQAALGGPKATDFRLPQIAQSAAAFVGRLSFNQVWLSCAIWGALVYFIVWLPGGFVRLWRGPDRKNVNPQNWFVTLFWAPLAGAVGGVLLWSDHQMMAPWIRGEQISWHVVGLGTAIMVVVFSLTVTVHIGLMGRGFPDEKREWFGRFGGLLLLAAAGWVALFAVAIYGPFILMTKLGAWKGSAAVTAWVASTISGLLVGNSSSTGDDSTDWKLSIVEAVTPYVFVVGLLLILSIGVFFVSAELQGAPAGNFFSAEHYWRLQEGALDEKFFMLLAVTFLGSLALSSRVDINEFSMNMLYRNRLVRCYLGASHCGRRPQPYTGFDSGDDVLLKELVPTEAGTHDKKNGKDPRPYFGPYPILNATLNLVKGQDLAWQERKAESFIFTPRFSGFDASPSKTGCHDQPLSDCFEPNAYRPTGQYGYADGGPFLGTAVAISGAAASPNMGYHSSPALGFLMTIFNVRLGWWFGNPHRKKPDWRGKPFWQRPGPSVGLFYLIIELLGLTDDERRYVYLSDGGHFENLALYELVRRRCRFIIAGDADSDFDMAFGDLGNAIEKCRTDFGIDIEIDVESLRCDPTTKLSKWHCVVGKIHYENVDKDIPPGVLLYLKPSLTGDEPTDVLRYKSQHPKFPDQTTANQWFDESEFESYRALGQHIAEDAFLPIADKEDFKDMEIEELLVRLRQHWYPPSSYVAASFTKHTATYSALLEKMRNDPKLQFLDTQVYSERLEIIEKKNKAGNGARIETHPQDWLPADEEHFRAGFYFCNEMIQLFEDAYIDLHLEEEYDHPDNRGWMNLFLRWAWSGMFSATWAICAGTYGARFQRFCRRRLDLTLGTVEIEKPTALPDRAKDLDDLLKKIEHDKEPISSWELQLVRVFLEARKKTRGEHLPQLSILPFRMKVGCEEDGERALNNSIDFLFGFALARVTHRPGGKPLAEIKYFRIRNHIRKMGLARKALTALGKDYEVTNRVRPFTDEQIRKWKESERPAEAIPELKGSYKLESILEALPTDDAALEFKSIFQSIHDPRQES
jgi:patatin-like phospholipase